MWLPVAGLPMLQWSLWYKRVRMYGFIVAAKFSHVNFLKIDMQRDCWDLIMAFYVYFEFLIIMRFARYG